MKTKFENLSNELFNKKLSAKESSMIFGGITYERLDTYVAQNGDHVDCGEDYRGKSCGDTVSY